MMSNFMQQLHRPYMVPISNPHLICFVVQNKYSLRLNVNIKIESEQKLPFGKLANRRKKFLINFFTSWLCIKNQDDKMTLELPLWVSGLARHRSTSPATHCGCFVVSLGIPNLDFERQWFFLFWRKNIACRSIADAYMEIKMHIQTIKADAYIEINQSLIRYKCRQKRMHTKTEASSVILI